MKFYIILLSVLTCIFVSCEAVEIGEDGSRTTFDNTSTNTYETDVILVALDAVEAVPILGAPFGFGIDTPVGVGESFLSGSSLAVSLVYNSSGEVAAQVQVNNLESSDLDLELCLTKVNRRTCQSVRNDVISSQASKEV